jgi:DNA-3-methyladenine glycosylase I
VNAVTHDTTPCRCAWVDLSKPDYVAYHDEEWGVPVHDDRKLFEFIVLESAQAGLSWYTILRKRENYRQAFDDFDPEKIALYDATKVEELLGNAGIIRNRLKVLATINNAQRFLAVQAEFGSFDAYLWQFVGGKPIVNHRKTLADGGQQIVRPAFRPARRPRIHAGCMPHGDCPPAILVSGLPTGGWHTQRT